MIAFVKSNGGLSNVRCARVAHERQKITGKEGKQILAIIVSLFCSGTSLASPIIVGHSGSGSFIETYDFATGGTTASFPTSGAATDGRGRGVEVVGNTVYYTAVSGDIHLAPYASGAGGPDFNVLPNPRPSHGIQDLDFFNGRLYALTGYPGGAPIVYQLNPITGEVIESPVAIMDHFFTDADAFTVLPNGDFLINDHDASATYRGYNSITGIPTGLVITLPALGQTAIGVDYNPGDGYLYFYGLFTGANPGLARTTLTGTNLEIVPITGGRGGIEDISVLVPEPASLSLLALGMVCGLYRRR